MTCSIFSDVTELLGGWGASHVDMGDEKQGVPFNFIAFAGYINHCQGAVRKNCIMKTTL